MSAVSPQIVMIADDLSGAADCAASCAAQGLRTIVQLTETQPDADSAQVLAIDAATRSMSPDRAAATVARLAATYPHTPGRVLFKKLDSLLRGHVGPELAAMRCERSRSVIVMAPALPAQNRLTRDGCQWLNGTRLPAADAPKMLDAAGLTSAQINLALIRGAPPPLAGMVADLARQYDVLICDAETEGDLQAIAAAIAALPHSGWAGSVIWSGSSGLARHIPKAIGVSGTRIPVTEPHFRGPILLVVGSRTALAHEQAREAALSAGMTTLLLKPETLRAGPGSTHWISQSSALAGALASGSDVIAVIDSSAETTEDPRLCAALASWVLPHGHQAGALIVTGGETARALLMALEITGLCLLREVEPGVPLALSVGARHIPVITKSGSFGERATLAHCVQVLRDLKLK